MYDIIFYEDKNGKNEILEYMSKLQKEYKRNKDSRIKFNKIRAYIEILKINGIAIREPYIKHLERRYMGTETSSR